MGKNESATILVVDDNPPMLHAVSRLLEHSGFRVLQASNGRECLETTKRFRPDLVLLDVRLPDINGVEVLKMIKQDPELSDVFVVHLSAQVGDPATTMQGLMLGADGYISQPVDNHELLIRVHAFLRHRRAMVALGESEARYRSLFDHSPQPMWIYACNGFQFLAVNKAATEHYGYSAEEFRQRTLNDLIVWTAEHQKPPVPIPFDIGVELQHRKRDGTVIDVLVVEHAVEWEKQPARVSQILDLTERKRLEIENQRRLQHYEAELKAVSTLSSPLREERTEAEKAAATLRQVSPTIFASLHERYEALVTRALEEKIFKMPNEVSPGLKGLASRLGDLKATPRDVIELHHSTIKRLAPSPAEPKAQGYIEVGRLTLIELMGYLVCAYRDQVLQGQSRSN